MDLLQKSNNLIERQRRKRVNQTKNGGNNNKMDVALSNYRILHKVSLATCASQQSFLKDVQKHFMNLNQWPAMRLREFTQVKILNAISPKEIFVLMKCNEALANKFHNELNDDYSKNTYPLLFCIKVGIICITKSLNGWQRCRIIKLTEQTTCDVLMIDTGMKERVKWNDLRLIDVKWTEIKPLATRCTLVSVIPAYPIERVTIQQQQYFEQIIKNESEFYVFMNRPDPITSEIFLYYKSENEFNCINEIIFPPAEFSDDSSIDETELSKIGHGTTSNGGISSQKEISLVESVEKSLQMGKTESKSQEQNHCAQKNDIKSKNDVVTNVENKNDVKHRHSSPPPIMSFSKPEPVRVNHIDGIDGIFICFQQYLNNLNKLRHEVQEYVQNQINDCQPHNWQIGDYCVVFDSFDGINEWIRGKIVSIIDDEKCQVYLRDVGKIIESPFEKLRLINDRLRKVRDFTWKMQLSHIKLEKGCSRKMVNELLYDIIASFDNIAISAFRDKNEMILWGIKTLPGALLPEKFEYVNINEELVRQKVAKAYVPFDGVNNAVNNLINAKHCRIDDSEIEHDTPNIYKVTNEKMDVKQWLPSEPILKRQFPAFPMHVSRSIVLWILEESRKTTVEQIQNVLNMKGQTLEKRNPIEWQRGDACFALFDDNKYYRAEIRRVNLLEHYCMVRFIDYGNCGKIAFYELRKANMFGNIPILIRNYELDNIKAPNDDNIWPEYVQYFCNDLVVNKQCNLITIEKPNHSTSPNDSELCILEIFTKDKDLGSALVSSGFAERINDVCD